MFFKKFSYNGVKSVLARSCFDEFGSYFVKVSASYCARFGVVVIHFSHTTDHVMISHTYFSLVVKVGFFLRPKQ